MRRKIIKKDKKRIIRSQGGKIRKNRASPKRRPKKMKTKLSIYIPDNLI